MTNEKENNKKVAEETHKATENEVLEEQVETGNPEENTEENEPSVEDKLKDYEDQIAELKDKFLYLTAEFDNYRKRVIKEKSELILNGGENVIKSLLPVIDDFERALQSIDKSDDNETLKQGVELIYQKLMKALESNGLKVIDTKDSDFDTDFHEAVALVPVPADELKGKVIDCVQKGYKLNEKVIRHARVAVGQ